MTNREIISQVRDDLNANNLDQWIPGKYIWDKLVNTAQLFIKREGDNKNLYRFTELWTPVPCLKMIEKPLIDCCSVNIPNCTTVMRSEKKLPEMYTIRSGYIISVMSLDYEKDYTITTPQQYKNLINREYQDKRTRYAWLENDYLIIPKSMVTQVSVRAMFINKVEALKLNCSTEAQKACYRLLDEEFIAPGHLLKDITDATVQTILRKYSVTPDVNPDLNQLSQGAVKR